MKGIYTAWRAKSAECSASAHALDIGNFAEIEKLAGCSVGDGSVPSISAASVPAAEAEP